MLPHAAHRKNRSGVPTVVPEPFAMCCPTISTSKPSCSNAACTSAASCDSGPSKGGNGSDSPLCGEASNGRRKLSTCAWESGYLRRGAEGGLPSFVASMSARVSHGTASRHSRQYHALRPSILAKWRLPLHFGHGGGSIPDISAPPSPSE